MWKKFKVYIVSVFIALGVGFLSSSLSGDFVSLYSNLDLPAFALPSSAFPIVWTVLYILMGISSAIIYLQRSSNTLAADNALTLYGGNLIINFMWSIIFFGFEAFLFAFIWLIFLLITVISMSLSFRRIKPLAGYLQILYATFLIYAGYLNLSIYLLNK
jgi:tryptophan-rich sensory protein